ncbi:MAG: hypothetical protein FWC15_01720 [Fibromonadales bacterium]|nr:hypothetical protein [Fibromonadales bacterium]
MNITKLFAVIAASAILFACGSQDGGVTPKLENSGVNRISPYDTLVARFNSTIVDIDKLGIENIVNTPNNSNVIKLIGTYGTTPGGAPYFKPNQLDSIAFSNIKNSDGLTLERASIVYLTHQMLDEEPNDDIATASIVKLDTAKAIDTVVFAGVLDHRYGSSSYDMVDHYKLNLQAADTLSITVSNVRENLTLEIKGPTHATETEFSIVKGANNKFKYNVGTNILLDPKPEYFFYLIVFDNDATAKPNYYTISVEKNKMRNP